MDTNRTNDTDQATFWDTLPGRILEPADLEPYGIEHVDTPERLREIRRRYPRPTAIDAGSGLFGPRGGHAFTDQTTGRVMAYASPVLLLRTVMQDQKAWIRVTPHRPHRDRRPCFSAGRHRRQQHRQRGGRCRSGASSFRYRRRP
jgi:hypothetical protein